jgi:hypothetical protein
MSQNTIGLLGTCPQVALNLGMMRCVAKNTKAEKKYLLDFSKVEFYWTF